MDNLQNLPMSRRPVVGIMTGGFHTDYSQRIAEAICDASQALDADICLFQGLDAYRFLNLKDYVDTAFDSHYYARFEYSKFLRPDLLVISFGTISAIPDPVSLDAFLGCLPQVPVILLEDETLTERGTYITTDNYTGMSECIEHLIELHGCRQILLLSGPKGIYDAQVRLRAYRDTMKRNGLEVREDMIAFGDFTDHVDGVIEGMLRLYPRPDAIVCANDEMAESAYRVLRAHGLIPGRDVKVTGFDDNSTARYMDPPLTSVRQSVEQVAEETVEVIRGFLRGERPKPVYIHAKLMKRCSCGCGERESIESAKLVRAMEDRSKIKQLTHENMLTSLMLRNLLSENISVHSFFRKLGELFRSLGTERTWIGLLEEPMTVDSRNRLFVPDELRLHMVQDGDDVLAYSREEAPLIIAGRPESRLSELTPVKNPTSVFSLFYGNVQYGVFMANIRKEDTVFYYTLSLEIGTGLRYLSMALAEQEARRTLEEKNFILDFAANHDSLTGLYSRAGAMNEIYTFVRSHGRGHKFVAVMADLDHLKQINDTFGHDAGDRAIKKAAELLKSTLPEGSPLGRVGGDEFTGVFLADEEHTPEWFRESVRHACEKYNEVSSEPFYEGISVGCVSFDYEMGSDIPLLLKYADTQLYEAKKRRRQSVLRG